VRLGMMILVGMMLIVMLKLYHAQPPMPKKPSRLGNTSKRLGDY